MPVKKRARSTEQKIQRRDHILNTALELLDKSRFADISIKQIAEHSGLAKGTIFLYFRTKEELFLFLTERELHDWFDELDAALIAQPEFTTESFLKLLAATLENRQILIHLISILHVILEHNVTVESAREFRYSLHRRMLATAALLETVFPPASNGNGLRLLIWIYALLIGVQHLTEPASVVREVFREPGLEVQNLDFHDLFLDVTQTLLTGLQTKRKK
jgi:AcrR family transcriptional regulator